MALLLDRPTQYTQDDDNDLHQPPPVSKMATAKQTCSMCGKEVFSRRLRHHQMMCHRDMSKTGDRVVDILVTFIRTNGDYSQCGANLGQLIPCLHADGYTVEEFCNELEQLEKDGCIIRVEPHQDYYKFNYYLGVIASTEDNSSIDSEAEESEAEDNETDGDSSSY